MKKYYFNFAIFILVLALLLVGYFTYFQRPKIQEYSSEEFLMDTLVRISTYGTDTTLLQESTAKAFQEMRRLADLTDRFSNASGDIAQINALAGIRPVVVDKDVFRMLEMAQEYSRLTNGAFDITIGPVMDLWGFGQPREQVPAPDELRKALSLVGSEDLILDEQEQTAYLKKVGMSIDLGAVAKGYAVENAAQVLEEARINSAIINAGGNIRVIGKKESAKEWKVGIQDPRNPQALIGILSLENEAAVTSGDYQRNMQINGQIYHHILSPRTGYPADELMSVTVIAEDSAEADLLSTALFLMEPEQAFAFVTKRQKTEAILITADKRILLTPGLQGRIELTAGEEYVYEKKTDDES